MSIRPKRGESSIPLRYLFRHGFSTLEAFGWIKGYNDTLQLAEISNSAIGYGSQNVQPTNDPGWKTRLGSSQLIGLLNDSVGPVTGLISYVYGVNRRLLATASNGTVTKVYHDGGGTTAWTALTNTFASLTALVEGVIRDDNSKLYLSNGVDTTNSWDGTTEGTIAVVQGKAKKLLYWLGRLVGVAPAANTNYTVWLDEFAETFTATSFFPAGARSLQGGIIYQKNLYIWNDEEMWRIRDFVLSTSGNNVAPNVVDRLNLGTAPVNTRMCCVGSDGIMYWMDRKGQVWHYNGSTLTNISHASMQRTIDSISLGSLKSKGCSIAYRDQVRFAVPTGSSATNDTEMVYDITRKIWLPPMVGLNIGVYCIHPDANGTPNLYYGDALVGAVFQMDTGNYDEKRTATNAVAVADTDLAVTGSTSLRVGQTFTVGANEIIERVGVMMKKNGGITAQLTFRVETTSGGLPTGTLLNANTIGTVAAFSNASYVWKEAVFSSNTANAATSTTYALVIQHTIEGSGTSDYRVGAMAAGTYANGNVVAYNGSWSATVGQDCVFYVTTKSAIDGRLVTRSFPFSNEEFKDYLSKIYYDFDASGAWNVAIGNNTDSYPNTWNEVFLPLNSASSTFGTGTWSASSGTWGTGIWGSSGRINGFQAINTRNRRVSLRFRTVTANQYFQIYGVSLNYQTIPNYTA